VRSFRDVPIRQKLILISVLASVVSLVLATAGFVSYGLRDARQRSHQAITGIAEVIAASSRAPLASGDRAAAAAILSAVGSEGRIDSACLYEGSGRLFASYGEPGGESPCPATRDAEMGRALGGAVLAVSVPVKLEGQPGAAVTIRARRMDGAGYLVRYLGIGVVVMLVSGAITLILASRLQRAIEDPIHRLVSTSLRVSFESDYSVRAQGGGKDELGQLIATYNEMLEQIQVRDRQLERHRDDLDAEVERRTQELAAVVNELRGEIAQREKAEARIRELAYYDVLTGLPNRTLLLDRLNRAIDAANRSGNPLALLFLDLDRFKEINDSWGHSTGDRLLEQVAERLMGCVRGADHISRPAPEGTQATVSRQGGDEFTVLLAELRSAHDAGRVCSRILEVLQQPFRLGEHDVVVGASIGVAIHPSDGEDADTLIKHADTAMYYAKASGRNDYAYFSQSMKAAAVERITLEGDLRAALEREQFHLAYQPIVDVESGVVTGVEALLRWRHPAGGRVGPSQFIPVAEEAGLIGALGDWALREACTQCRAWQRQGLPPIRVAVNVSGRQFRKGELLQSALRALEQSGLEPHFLDLEVTESTMLENEDEIVDTLRHLRELGVRVALDDFGTGYSSLSYLRRLPLDLLKIDRSFVAELTEGDESERIVSAVIAMAHGLGLRIVAEGVETPAQRQILAIRGCDEVQGYLESPPVPPEQIPALLVREKPPV
jgi:diguanylate cyclase (GGDEF)-like protein